MKKIKALLMCIVIGLSARVCAGSALGDWGHFVCYTPTACFNNSEGKPFTITIHVMRWANPDWNRDELTLRLTGPKGQVIVDGPQKVTKSAVTLKVKDAAKGVYKLHTKMQKVWFESSLPHAVVWTGDQGTNLHNFNDPITDKETGKKRKRHYYERHGPLVFQAVVPRRWWFWVPKDVTKFTAEALRDQWSMSQREDWGFFIISPRGQRIRALWGQPKHHSHASGKYHQRQRVEVEVEPGAAGRFWCLEVSLGDSHHYSDINIAFDGIPPYLARSPEEWFDPRTGKVPEVTVYDDTPFIQAAPLEGVIPFQGLHHKAKDPNFAWSAPLKRMEQRWPHLEHFSPCPSLGDPEGIEILGDGRYAIWNPDGRDLRFRVGSYILRKGEHSKDPDMAAVKIVGAGGKTVFDKKVPMHHIHDPRTSVPTDTIRTGKGVALVAISGVERWLSFTYPATPLVLVGKGDGAWKRFRFTACAPRNWYFFVPKGVKKLSVRFATDVKTDVLKMQVCAPDRTMALFYSERGRKTITVPDGLDGKIWYVRPSVGSATRLITIDGPNYRHQDIPLTLELKGVPGYLAPTWEQWFNPTHPVKPMARE